MSNSNTFVKAIKYLYSPGEQIYDIYRKKKGTIVCLRDDSYEKEKRASNPSNYYYHVNYDDGSFNTYVIYRDFIPLSQFELMKESVEFESSEFESSEFESPEIVSNKSGYANKSGCADSSVNKFYPNHNLNCPVVQSDFKSDISEQQFFSGQKFRCKFNGKFGTIRCLRDDMYEKKARISDPTHYYYHVDFDDGSFETYMNGRYLVHI